MPKSGGSYIVKDGVRTPVVKTKAINQKMKVADLPASSLPKPEASKGTSKPS